MREQLVAIAGSSDPEQEWTAKRAGDSLRAIDAQKAGPSALLTADEKHFMQIGHALQAVGQDHRGLVPVLIELLDKFTKSPPTDSEFPLADVYVQWLEGIASRALDKDVAAWKAFWRDNQNKTYCQWMMEAAQQDSPVLVQNALSRLAFCAQSREAADFLAARIQTDRGDNRKLAALALAQHRDRRAVPVLIEMLVSDSGKLRGAALVALGYFHDTTLGYDPEGDTASRAMALRRWRAWASSLATD